MSVILEFTIAGEAFALGRVLSGAPDMRLELERVVPTGDQVMPFVWARGDDHEAFANHVSASPEVKALHRLDRVDDSGLYRIEWADPPTDLIAGIAYAGATVLEAHGTGLWRFRLRLPDHDHLSQFHDYCTDHDIVIEVERTYTFTKETEQRRQFGLTQPQREALLLALERGYFATPSEVGLDELADDLDISRQALSNRIRRGIESLLQATLLSANSGAG